MKDDNIFTQIYTDQETGLELTRLVDLRKHLVYILYVNGLPIYVGRTIDIKKRLYGHKTFGKQFDSFSIAFECISREQADTYETVLISYLKSIHPSITNRNKIRICGKIEECVEVKYATK